MRCAAVKPEVLKDLREKANMTQQQLADLLFVSKYTVSKWEQGISQPKKDIEMMIANIFCVSLDYLNGSSSFSRFENVMLQEFSEGVTFVEIFDRIINLPEAYRSFVKTQLDALDALARERGIERKQKPTGEIKTGKTKQ